MLPDVEERLIRLEKTTTSINAILKKRKEKVSSSATRPVPILPKPSITPTPTTTSTVPEERLLLPIATSITPQTPLETVSSRIVSPTQILGIPIAKSPTLISQIPAVEEDASESSFTSLLTSSILMDPSMETTYDRSSLATPDMICKEPSHERREEPESKKRKVNKCRKFVRDQMKAVYKDEELAVGRFKAGIRKETNSSGTFEANKLSPNRLSAILKQAKKKFSKEEYDSMGNIADVVNAKCRQVKEEVRKRKLLDS